MVPPAIKQMLLVLQGVHRTPPSEQFFLLQNLAAKVVQPYLCMVTRSRPTGRAPSESIIEGQLSINVILIIQSVIKLYTGIHAYVVYNRRALFVFLLQRTVGLTEQRL